LSDFGVVSLTVRTAILAAILMTPFAIAIAWLLARKQWPGKSIIETIVALPLVMPPVATGLILLKTFGRRGPIGGPLHTLGFDIVFTWRAIVIAMAVMSFPLLVRASRIAFEEVPLRLEQIARTLGAAPMRVFFTVTLPLAKRGVIGGVLLAFARSLGEFGATILVAGNIPGRTTTVATSIYNSVQLGQDADAYRLLLFAVVVAFVAVWSAEAVNRQRQRLRT
jgi:molybdate transport system permease protein